MRCVLNLRYLLSCSIISFLLQAAVIAGEPEPLDTMRATALIAEAINAQRSLPAYVTTDYVIRGSDTCTIRCYVKNGPGRLRQRRSEVTLNVATKPVSAATYISNVSGVWKVSEGKAVTIDREPILTRSIPRRLATAELLGITGDISECTIEKNISYFGMPATKITVSLSAKLIDRLNREPELMKDSLLKASDGTVDDAEFEKTWRIRAKEQFPSAFVYVIHAQTPFVLAWQAYSSKGELVSEVAHQEFKVMNSFPASVFELPPPTEGDAPGKRGP